jgi:hypothetical protein
MITKKIHESGIIDFEKDGIELHDTLDDFKRITIHRLKIAVNSLDDFDKYILDYFYEGI